MSEYEDENDDMGPLDKERPALFIDKPSNEELQHVMLLLSKKGTKFYLPVVSTGLMTPPNVYFEGDDSGRYSGIGRIFLSEEGVNIYIRELVESHNYDVAKFKPYTLSVDSAVKHAKSINDSSKKPIKFIISYHKVMSDSLESIDYSMIDLMTFWDGIPN